MSADTPRTHRNEMLNTPNEYLAGAARVAWMGPLGGPPTMKATADWANRFGPQLMDALDEKNRQDRAPASASPPEIEKVKDSLRSMMKAARDQGWPEPNICRDALAAIEALERKIAAQHEVAQRGGAEISTLRSRIAALEEAARSSPTKEEMEVAGVLIEACRRGYMVATERPAYERAAAVLERLLSSREPRT